MISSPSTLTGSRGTVVALLTMLLSACGGSQFAYFDDGGGLTLSIVREQNYLGGPWKSTLVSAATPRCQKRHPLPELAEAGFQLKVFRPEPGVYILNSGTQWYVTELRACEFQTYRAPPPFPGDAVGRFVAQGDKLEFVAEKAVKR